MQTSLQNIITFSDRLQQFIDYKRIGSVNKFAKILGYASSEKISRLFRGQNNSPSYEILTDIANKFEDLSIDWLISGSGNMIKTTPNFFRENSVKTTPNSTPNTTPNLQIIPITDISVAAGAGAINGDHLEVTDTIQLPENLVKKGTYLCVRIKGESMAPTLQDGGFLIIRLLDKGEWEKQQDERIYVISDTEGNTYVKRLKLRVKKGFVVCKSDNPDRFLYPGFNIQINDINTLWYAEWYLSAKMPNIHDQYYTRLQRLEDDVDEMKAKFKQIKL